MLTEHVCGLTSPHAAHVWELVEIGGRERDVYQCPGRDPSPSVGDDLEEAVRQTLSSLEEAGLSARDADEFIRDCVFTAWWDWDYKPKAVT